MASSDTAISFSCITRVTDWRLFTAVGAISLLLYGCKGMEYSPYTDNGYYGAYGPDSEAAAYYDLKAYREDKAKEKDGKPGERD